MSPPAESCEQNPGKRRAGSGRRVQRAESWDCRLRRARTQEAAANQRTLPHNERMSVRDTFGRPLRSLRLSVTDRCNIRCAYCMPELEYVWLPRGDLLTFEE